MQVANAGVSDALWIVVLFTAGAYKAIHTGALLRETESVSVIIATQRRRYTLITLGQLIVLACAGYILSEGSPAEVVAATLEWMSLAEHGWGLGFVGLIVAANLVLIVISPCITLWAAMHTYRNPADMAYRCGYLTYRSTRSVRGGYSELLSPVVCDLDPLRREFIPAK